MVRAALRWEITRLRVSSKRFPSNTHTDASPARDDDVGGPPYRHFDRSEAEWRNPSDGMCGITLGDLSTQSIINAFSICPYRHASPLEMTMLASAPIVISTEAKRSGEISLHHGTGCIGVGDLSTLSIIKAFSICPIAACGSARDDGGRLAPLSSFRPKRSGVEKSPPLMVRAALRWEISRLRISSKRFPSNTHTGASPRSR